MSRVVVVGAGIGGLTTAALLARAGLDVTVLEAHVYAGGCAGTFYHQGYRFDAGATLAGGFYPGGPMERVAQAAGIAAWQGLPAELAMTVHLPDGSAVPRWADERRWDVRRGAFGPASIPFWEWQERTADILWDLALATPPWPPQGTGDLRRLAAIGAAAAAELAQTGRLQTLPGLLADSLRPVAAHLRGLPAGPAAQRLRLFIDAQLLIAAQTTSTHANALYGASALDLPRRGVVHLTGGMGSLATSLAAALRHHGGRLLTRQEVTRIVVERRAGVLRPVAVETHRGLALAADLLVANLPPWNLARLLGEAAPRRLQALPPRPQSGWGAFTLYAGVDQSAVAAQSSLHHQVVRREPLGEGNSLFLSLSPGWDPGRAPAGQRALTLSTHTRLDRWWQLFQSDRAAYTQARDAMAQRLLADAEVALPTLRQAVSLLLPGTPVTFQRFTRRDWGWVGGFPQTDLWRAWPPRLMPGLWMVGDSIFPGQSIAAAALGGLRVGRSVLQTLGVSQEQSDSRSWHPLPPAGDASPIPNVRYES